MLRSFTLPNVWLWFLQVFPPAEWEVFLMRVKQGTDIGYRRSLGGILLLHLFICLFAILFIYLLIYVLG